MFKAIILALGVASSSAWMTDVELIKDAEGLKLCTYKDTMGIKTVCYGFNLERSSASRSVAAAGGNYNSLINMGCATQSVCDNLLNTEVQSARSIVDSQYGSSISCPAAHAVVVDMAYNMGSGGLAQFKNFKKSLQAGDWNGAANGLQHSAYCGQVGRRCTRNMNQIKSCN